MKKRFTPPDYAHMQRALSLARRGQGRVEPNPMVGCVIARRGKVVGEGYHQRFGGPHAEINALRAAGRAARGADCYVTLEPCCHHGKTPPCTNALIEAGVARLIVAMRDPFPQVRGRGFRQLRKAGIEVAVGVCEDQARALNGSYLKVQRTGRPWVILKWAQSLDGKIATRKGDSKWISDERSRAYAHRIRGRVDAIVAGVTTVQRDDPLLTCRHGRPSRVATRVVIDPECRMPRKSQLLRTAREIPTIVCIDVAFSRSPRAAYLQRQGVEVIGVARGRAGLDLGALLETLGRRGMSNVMVEGGGRTLGCFLDQGLADEAVVFVAPRLIGGRDAVSPWDGQGPATMDELPTVILDKVRQLGGDQVYHLRLTDAAAR